MRPQHLVPLYLVVLVLSWSGCTPLSERVAQRTLHHGAVDELHQRQTVSLSRFEQELSSRIDRSTFAVLQQYGTTIRACADRYGLDWRLVLAVMKTESAFLSVARSQKGAYGLMQIMPVTGAELARALDLMDVQDPSNNIYGGVYYLRQLYDMFRTAPQADRLKLALAAYNAGIGRVYDAQELTMFFHGNPTRWSSVRHSLALLSSDQCELHSIIWAEGRPRSGCFNNSGETLAYVDKVLEAYAQYKQVLD